MAYASRMCATLRSEGLTRTPEVPMRIQLMLRMGRVSIGCDADKSVPASSTEDAEIFAYVTDADAPGASILLVSAQ
jgi:hypothetical protein